MRKFLTFFLTALLAFGVGWASTVTLSNENIVAAGTGTTGYNSWTLHDGNSNTWYAYAIKNQHSNATSSYHYLQIKKYSSTTAYYIQVPVLGTKITQIVMTVSNTNNPMGNGGNNVTLFFSNSNSTSAAGDGVASGTGASSVTIDCSSLNLNTGYITANGGVRIWDVTVIYDDTPSTDSWITVNPSMLNINQDGGIFTVNAANMPNNGLGVFVANGSSDEFSFTATDDNTFSNTYFPLTPNGNGKYNLTNGHVKVNFTGRPVKATRTIGFASGDESTQATVNYLYDGDIYIVGNVEGYSWTPPVSGLKMDKNADGTYSQTITTYGGDDGYAYLYFTKSIGAENFDALGNNSFGPLCTGDNNQPIGSQTWMLNEDTNGKFCALDANGNLNTFKLEPGQYTITVKPATNQFMIEKAAEPVTYVKVTSTDQLVAGKKYILVHEGSATKDPSAMGTIDSGFGTPKPVTITDNKVTITDNDVIVFTLGGSLNAYTLQDANGKYLSAGNSTNVSLADNSKTWRINNNNNSLTGYRVSNGDQDVTRSIKRHEGDYERYGHYSNSDTQSGYALLYVEDDGSTPPVQTVATPVITPGTGTYTEVQNVEITCATEGANISYKIGDGEYQPYTTAIEVGESCTITAKATKDGWEPSAEATATYTINLPIEANNLAAAKALDDDQEFNFTGDVVVTFKQAYTTSNGAAHTLIGLRDKDATEGGGVFHNAKAAIYSALDKGSVLNPGWTADKETYNGWIQFEDINNVTTAENPVEVLPFDRTGQTLTTANQSEYIILNNVTINGNTATVNTGAKAATSYTLYDRFNVEYEDGE